MLDLLFRKVILFGLHFNKLVVEIQVKFSICSVKFKSFRSIDQFLELNLKESIYKHSALTYKQRRMIPKEQLIHLELAQFVK